MHHGLLVARLVVRHAVRCAPGRGRLQQRLPDPGDVAVAEDAPAGVHQAVAVAVALGVLAGEEPHQGLRDGEAEGGHRVSPGGAV